MIKNEQLEIAKVMTGSTADSAIILKQFSVINAESKLQAGYDARP